jgi:nucleotide-binding universal stress UspA family protein
MASGARADDPGVLSIQVTVGESTPVGPGPVRNLVCDDGSLVQLVDTSNGPVMKGLRAGTTLCSLTDVYSARRVYRVVVAPPPARPLAPQGGGSFARVRRVGRAMADWKRIGCAVDFSDGSRGALAEAESLARRFGAELVLLHVAEVATGSDIPPPASVVEATRRELAQMLETWRLGSSQALGRPVEAALLEGAAAPAIAHAASTRKVDLLVTGTHGRRGFRHLVLGSVAERLVHLASCSVLVVRA